LFCLSPILSPLLVFRETGHSREVIIDRECLHVEVPHEINLAEALKAAVPEQVLPWESYFAIIDNDSFKDL